MTPRVWRQELLAAIFAWGPNTWASHASSGELFEYPSFTSHAIELTIPRGRERVLAHRVHRTINLPPCDRAVVDAIPVTSPTRTIIDLASTTSSDVLEEVLDNALRRRLVTVSRLERRLRDLGEVGRKGRATLRKLLSARGDGRLPSESPQETRFLRVLRRAGLPLPAQQHPVGRARVDFAYVGEKIAIEVEGYTWHSGKHKWQDDLARRNALTEAGWRVLHITARDIKENPTEITATLARMLCTRVVSR